MADDTTRSIREVSELTGISAHTLRYYERIGLLGRVPRARNGHRAYGDTELGVLRFLRHLQATGMPIRDMQAYARLLRQGDSSLAARKQMLEAHHAAVRARIAELTDVLGLLERKITYYDARLRDAPAVPPEGRGVRVARPVSVRSSAAPRAAGK